MTATLSFDESPVARFFEGSGETLSSSSSSLSTASSKSSRDTQPRTGSSILQRSRPLASVFVSTMNTVHPLSNVVTMLESSSFSSLTAVSQRTVARVRRSGEPAIGLARPQRWILRLRGCFSNDCDSCGGVLLGGVLWQGVICRRAAAKRSNCWAADSQQ